MSLVTAPQRRLKRRRRVRAKVTGSGERPAGCGMTSAGSTSGSPNGSSSSACRIFTRPGSPSVAAASAQIAPAVPAVTTCSTHVSTRSLPSKVASTAPEPIAPVAATSVEPSTTAAASSM